jgi:hypothetical protein
MKHVRQSKKDSNSLKNAIVLDLLLMALAGNIMALTLTRRTGQTHVSTVSRHKGSATGLLPVDAEPY